MTTVELDRHQRNEAMRRRYDALRMAGYGWGTALRLAASPDVDPKRAAELLQRGCPVDTAVRILL